MPFNTMTYEKVAPPDEYKEIRHHFLSGERSSHCSVAEWVNGQWYCHNEEGAVSGIELARRGWKYHSPILQPAGYGYGNDAVDTFVKV